MQIVSVQLDPVWENKKASHAKILNLLEHVEIESGALVVFPEMFDTGFSMNIDATVQGDERESEAFLRELAKKYSCAVMGGVVAPLEGVDAANVAVAFDANGTELARYRKMQPFTLTGEDVKYGSGDRHRLFEWNGTIISPFICYDLRFPEVFRPAARTEPN